MYIPSSTYRVQLNHQYTLANLIKQVNYLHRLGVDCIYASPITAAKKGSLHGYDSISPLRLNEEIGTEKQLSKVSRRLKSFKMGWIQDIVPNHMAFHPSNEWLYDVLERGSNSNFYDYFDILSPKHGEPTTPILAPFLGDEVAKEIDNKNISLAFTENGFQVCCPAGNYPVSVQSWRWIVRQNKAINSAVIDLLNTLENSHQQQSEQWVDARQHTIQLLRRDVFATAHINEAVTIINNDKSLLQELLSFQHYELTKWDTSNRINYRRFFAINDLISLNMQNEQAFEHFHRYFLQQYKAGIFQGLRIDHIDGLRQPGEYLDRLRKMFGKDCYITVEKIWARNEKLPPDWDCSGTTGYDFLFQANRVLTNYNGLQQLQKFYTDTTDDLPYREIVHKSKLGFLKSHMQAEWKYLTNLYIQTGISNEEQVLEAIASLLASFPVYRMYPMGSSLTESDKRILTAAIAHAIEFNPGAENVLTGLRNAIDSVSYTSSIQLFIERLSQFTGPLAAKGIEDTTFYTYNYLISQNEVGCDPGPLPCSVNDFHTVMKERAGSIPHTQNATATHDTKRGEDARMRINLLTAYTGEWIALTKKISNACMYAKTNMRGTLVPAFNEEYLIYQGLAGSLPVDEKPEETFRKRFKEYITKALREGKTHTTWEEPNEEYEQCVLNYIDNILMEDSPFLSQFIPFLSKMRDHNEIASLSQLLIKLTAPGIPDIYQGTEIEDVSFVDPDNRRSIDYNEREQLLETCGRKKHKKVFVMSKTLKLRKKFPQLFANGSYEPIDSSKKMLAFQRTLNDESCITCCPLLYATADEITTLRITLPSPGKNRYWKNVFTNEKISSDGIIELQPFESFPVAVYISREH